MTWIYWIGWLLFGSAFRSLFGMRVIGREHLITEGPVLVASNVAKRGLRPRRSSKD